MNLLFRLRFFLPFLLARPYVPRCVPPSAWRFPRRGTWKHSNLWRDWPQWRQMQHKRPGFFQLNTAMSGCLRNWLFDAAIHTDSKPQIHLGLEGGFPSRRFQCTWRRHQGSIAPGNSGVLCQLQLLDMNEFGTAGIPIKGKPLERSAQDVYFTSLGIVFKIRFCGFDTFVFRFAMTNVWRGYIHPGPAGLADYNMSTGEAVCKFLGK